MRSADMQLLRHGLGYMMNRQLGLGWNVWLEFWQEELHKKASMGASMGHMANRELSKGWNGWFQLWQDAVRAKQSMGGALRHMMNRELSKGWRGWQGRPLATAPGGAGAWAPSP